MLVNKYGVKRACGLALLMISSGSFAGQESSGFTLSPMVGKYMPAKNRELDDSTFWSIGAGYDFDDDWGAELSYLSSSADVDGAAGDVDLDVIRLDALRYFGSGDLRPYAVMGVGEAEFEMDDGSSGDDTVANLGAGIKYAVNEMFSLRGDFRLMHGMDSGESDYLLGVGALFKFGASSGSKSDQPKPIVAAAPTVGDGDDDGVPNAKDQCPNSMPGVEVDVQGCVLVMDADQDGVSDAKDQCPTTDKGAKVDEVGCYVVLKEAVSITLNVQFKTNSSDVVASSLPEIKALADFLKLYPKTNAVIEGHTDSSGAAAYNKQLSQKRAEAVAAILVDTHSVDNSRLTPEGYGEERPLVSNDTVEGRAKNRRVTAVVSAVSEIIIK